MQHRNTLLTALFALGATAACGDLSPTGARTEAPAALSAQQVSRGVALALNDAGLREQLRDAMRASPFTEHKLLLAEYMATPQGAALSAAAARALGVTEAEFATATSRLPAMDFYVPGRTDRLSWQGGANVAVFATLARSGAVAGFDLRGRAVQAPASLEGAEVVEIMMHPAESRSYRLQRQDDVPGRVIQDPTDGDIGIVETTLDQFGNVLERVDLGRVETARRGGARLATWEENNLYCAQPGYDLDTGCRLKDTYSTGFRANVEDGDGAWGSLEIIFKNYFTVNKNAYGEYTAETTIVHDINGVTPYTWIDLRTRYNARLGLKILDNTPSVGGCGPFGGTCQGDEVSVSVREDDGGFGQDRYGNAVWFERQSGESHWTSTGKVVVQTVWVSPWNNP